MKIAIAGAGIAGSYLYRLLTAAGFEPDVFETGVKTHCHIRPCAWGSSAQFMDLVNAIELNPEDYILRRFDEVEIESITTKANLITFDKPKLLRDTLAGAEIHTTPLIIDAYDRVIDATGLARAYLPPIDEDLVAPCVQCRIPSDETDRVEIKGVSVGYAWSFPISKDETHVGCGSLSTDPRKALKQLNWLDGHSHDEHAHAVCACHSSIRLTAPQSSQPFVLDEKIWGVGEAIGCVSPLVADGIVSSMQSCRILLDHWEDPHAYTRGILDHFDWMVPERRLLDQLAANERLSIRDALAFSKNLSRMGIELSLDEAILILKSIAAISSNGADGAIKPTSSAKAE